MTSMDMIKPEPVCVMPSCRIPLEDNPYVGKNNGYFCIAHWRMLPIYLKTAITRAIRDNSIRDIVYFVGESIEYINKALPYVHD